MAEDGAGAPYDSERRVATVMFADISGFTALSEKLDPERVTEVMNGCFQRLESVVFAHGGIVDEYLGDCVKAVFGFSPDTTDPTSHAVHAALEIRDTLYQYNRDAALPSPLDIHIGINTGPVISLVMHQGKRNDFSVLGDTVRLAGKLEDVSDRGDIFVGPETYAATADEFDYEARDPVVLQPYPEPFAVWELRAAKQVRRLKRESERRQATVVFAEVVGLDALSGHLDRGAMGRIMHALFGTLAEAVTEFGGVVDKFLGEGIMALFGVPNAIENAPRQGLNATIEMRNRLSRFIEEHALPVHLELHCGVNTGLCIAGDIGGRVKHDFTVMGDTVNLAARLKEAAEHGAIYVGPETHRYTRDDFEFTPTEPLRLKGKSQAIAAQRLLSTAPRVHRSSAGRADRMVFSAMVGRDAEVAAFRSRIDALSNRKGGIINLVGEAGLGKSRLLAEVFQMARAGGMRVLLGRCLSMGRSLSFHPFVDLLRDWATISDDADQSTAQPRLEAAVRSLLPARADEVYPFIARLMGYQLIGPAAERVAGIEGEALEKLIIRSVRELFEAIAAQQPTLVVFEDLHWADLSSLNLLESLLPIVGEQALLFVHACRPLFEDTSERIIRFCRDHCAAILTDIRLEPLSDQHSARLVSNLLSIADLPDSLRRLIASKAEGNPFYIEEVVRSLIDEGAVIFEDGGYRVTERINTVVIPGTIHDVIMARVDRLDEPARHLLQLASVIGRHFYSQVLAAIVESSEMLGPNLALLEDKQLIEPQTSRWEVAVGERRVREELEYVFRHALAQEAVYESILLKTRKELHQKVAGSIESVFQARLNQFYATLAYHFTRGEQLEQAETYLFKAGEEAERAAASAEALSFFREAATIYEQLHSDGGDSLHRAALQKHIGMALLNTGQHNESIPHFDDALTLLGEPVARTAVTQALRWAVDMSSVLLHVYLGRAAAGRSRNLEHDREVCKLFFERGHAEVTSDPRRLFLELATGLRRLNSIDPHQIDEACGMFVSCAGIFAYSGLSFAISKRMLAVAKDLIREGSIRDLFVYRAMAFTYEYLRGHWAAAPTIEDRMVDDALGHGLVWDVTLYVGLEMDRRLRRGDFDGARVMLGKLAEIRDTYGYAYAGSNHNGMLAILLIEERRLEEALPLTLRHHEVSQEGTLKLMTLGMAAKIHTLLGQRDAAADALQRAVEVTRREGVVSPWHQSIHHVAQLLFDLTALEAASRGSEPGRLRRLRRNALNSVRRAVRTAAKVGKERIETYNLSAQVYWALGRQAQALEWWRRCVREAETMGARPELARAYAAMSVRLGDQSFDGLSADACGQRARREFSELNLAWDLQRLDGDADESQPEAAVA